jgi:putative transcriptional regulator
MSGQSKIIKGLKDAARHASGDRTRGTSYIVNVPHPLDIRAIRKRQGLTQKAFAEKYGFPLATLRNWEQGYRVPSGASRNFLLVIERQPMAVEAALSA